MARLELHILWAGACSLLAAMGLAGGMDAAGPVTGAKPEATVMASYVEKAARPQAGAATSTHEIFPEADGLFYVNAEFAQGRRLRFLVDTGASVTVLTAHDAKLMGINPVASAGGAKLRTAGGTMVARPAVISRMAISGRELRDVEAAIIDNGLPVSLLGQNALSELGTITLGKGRMTIH